MRAVLIEAYGVPARVTEVDDPEAAPGGVVLKVESTGLCRTDWHAWRGHDDGIRLPHVPGHELAGTIAEVGAGVTGWSVGERVTVPFVCACGTCVQCRAGDQQVCPNQEQPGFTYWGSFAEYVAVPYAEVNLVRLPDGLGYDTAAGARLPVRHRLPRDHPGRPGPSGRVGRGLRLRRGRAVRGDDRRRRRGEGDRGRHQSGGADAGRRVRRRAGVPGRAGHRRAGPRADRRRRGRHGRRDRRRGGRPGRLASTAPARPARPTRPAARRRAARSCPP